MKRTTRTQDRERLSREVVAGRALAIADAEGLDGLTIRRLATDLGVTPMALYWHFADKDALLAGVAEQLLGEVLLPEGSVEQDWSGRLRDLLSALLVTFRAHPRLARLAQTQILACDPGLEVAERALNLLHQAGFDTDRAAQLASHALSTIVELVITEPGAELDAGPDAREERVRMKKARLFTLPPGSYPTVVASIDALTSCHDEESYYELGLDVFIAGARAALVGAAR